MPNVEANTPGLPNWFFIHDIKLQLAADLYLTHQVSKHEEEAECANHVLYLRVAEGKVAKTLEEVTPGVNIDVDVNGNTLGIEVLTHTKRS